MRVRYNPKTRTNIPPYEDWREEFSDRIQDLWGDISEDRKKAHSNCIERFSESLYRCAFLECDQ